MYYLHPDSPTYEVRDGRHGYRTKVIVRIFKLPVTLKEAMHRSTVLGTQ